MTRVQVLKLYEYWIKESRKDFDTANAIIKVAKRYAAGLFFLHLSIEKRLKAEFVKKFQQHAPVTHNLFSLLESCEISLPRKHAASLAVINEFNMSTRYPEEKSKIAKNFNQKFAQNYLKKGREILSWLDERT